MICINPTYEPLRAWLSEPQTLMAKGRTIHIGRNELRRVEVQGQTLCIKQYGVPGLLNRWIYRHWRMPKGLRAYRNAFRLREAGFDTPEPMAYIQYDTWWGIGESYYICRYVPGQTLYQWGDKPLAEIREDVQALALYAARMHDAGLMLCDFTPGNILLTADGFTLVDINRMRAGTCSIRQGLSNMAGLWLQPEVADFLAVQYAAARGMKDTEQAIQRYRAERRAFWRHFTRRHHLTDCIVHTDVDGSRYTYHFNATIR